MPELGQLEGRALLSVSGVSIATNPAYLWPPNGRSVPVTVSGQVIDNDANAHPTANFRVIDEYGAVQPSGSVTLHQDGGGVYSYAFTTDLQASRTGRDKDGRQYTIQVIAQDTSNSLSNQAVVTVPHDQGNHNGRFSHGGVGGLPGNRGNQGGQEPGKPDKGHRGNHGKGHGNIVNPSHDGSNVSIVSPSNGGSNVSIVSPNPGQGHGDQGNNGGDTNPGQGDQGNHGLHLGQQK